MADLAKSHCLATYWLGVTALSLWGLDRIRMALNDSKKAVETLDRMRTEMNTANARPSGTIQISPSRTITDSLRIQRKTRLRLLSPPSLSSFGRDLGPFTRAQGSGPGCSTLQAS